MRCKGRERRAIPAAYHRVTMAARRKRVRISSIRCSLVFICPFLVRGSHDSSPLATSRKAALGGTCKPTAPWLQCDAFAYADGEYRGRVRARNSHRTPLTWLWLHARCSAFEYMRSYTPCADAKMIISTLPNHDRLIPVPIIPTPANMV